jgi:hypothetical protein
MKELLEASLVKLSKGEYALAIIMTTKKDVFDSGWTLHLICISFVANVD